MSLPARLIVDQFQPQPSTLSGGTQSFVLRVHVTSTCGGPVQGAIVYGTPTPFNQFGETQSNSGSDGWATLTFSRQANFPVNGKQQILAMFLRASKPGENILAGITASGSSTFRSICTGPGCPPSPTRPWGRCSPRAAPRPSGRGIFVA